MHDESTQPRSWIQRLSDALLREPQDRQQLLNLLEDAQERNLLSYDSLVMIEGVLQVSELQVRDVMLPRRHMVILDQDLTPEQALPTVIESAHSRFPVINQDKDEVVGILLAKDLLKQIFRKNGKPSAKIYDLMRPAVFIPESKRLDVLLKEFRLNRNHMAIVVDEYGGIAGLITIEDVLEQIVGDIADEYDNEMAETNIRQLNTTEFLVNAITPIEEINHYFKLSLDKESFDTIGGVVAAQFGHVPQAGENITLDKYKVEIIKATDRQIKSLKFIVDQS